MDSRNIHCSTCKHYSINEDFEKKNFDGWCALGMRINGKLCHKPTGVNEWDGKSCTDWTDKTTSLTHFEVMCKVPEAKRSENEIEYLAQFVDWRERKEWWNR